MIRLCLLALLIAAPAFAGPSHDHYQDGEPEQGGAEERGEAPPTAPEPEPAPPEEPEAGGAEERGEVVPAESLGDAPADESPSDESPADESPSDESAGSEAPAGEPSSVEPSEGPEPATGLALALPVEGVEPEEGGHEERGEHVPELTAAVRGASAGRIGGTMALLLLLLGGGFGVAHAVRQQTDA